MIINLYDIYYHLNGCPVGDQEKNWAPHKICKKCCLGLHNWLNNRSSSMLLVVPMISCEPKDHGQDCYFLSIFCYKKGSFMPDFMVCVQIKQIITF